MGGGCSKDNSDVVSNNDDKNRGLPQPNGNTITKNPLSSPSSANMKTRPKRQQSVSIVGVADDDDDNCNSKSANDSFGNTGSPGAANILPVSPPFHSTSSPSSRPHSNLSGTSTQANLANTQPSVATTVELPAGAILRRDSSVSMPTHNRRRGSSVSLVLTPEQADVVKHPERSGSFRRSPPAAVLSREGSSGMEELNLLQQEDKTGLVTKIVEAQQHQELERKNSSPLSGRGSHRQHSSLDNSPQPQSQQQGMLKGLEDIPVATEIGGNGEMSISVSNANDEVLAAAATTSGSPSRRQSSHFGGTSTLVADDPDAAKMIREGAVADPAVVAQHANSTMNPFMNNTLSDLQQQNGSGNNTNSNNSHNASGTGSPSASLLLPTHNRKRGSSVSLVMAPEDHLKSPKAKSPTMRSFDEIAKGMTPLALGNALVERDTEEEDAKDKKYKNG